MNRYYKKENHINNLIDSSYYKNLVLLRNTLEIACDTYFQRKKAPKIDLYLIAQEVSSPIGKGSDSLPIPISIGSKKTYLVDSAQFGMEPLVQKKFNMVYCYLPSFRGEEPNERHLNQFYHCESELRGDYKECMKVAEGLVKFILNEIQKAYRKKLFKFTQDNFSIIPKIIASDFPVITFDEAHKLLSKQSKRDLIITYPFGRVITNNGEKELLEIVTKNKLPIWLTKYDRDTVPFYQKPDPNNKEKALNADLLFPSTNGGFGGEVIGSGERQNNRKEMEISIKRQDIHAGDSYEWYLHLRERVDYKNTSGFGMGVERFIAWLLGLKSIHDVCIYPVIKNDFK